MRKLICISITLFMGIFCFGQEVECSTSLNTSSEQRFQNAQGIGLQYQQDISTKFKLGFGVHYNFNNVNFNQLAYIDAIPFPPSVEKVHSKSKRVSFRLNIQGLLKNNEYVSISLGPEINYSYLWGNDDINMYYGGDTKWTNYSRKNVLTRAIGIGLISKIEIKDFIKPQLSLCFTIRPEFTANGVSAKGGSAAFSPAIGFVEFQIGLKYRFKK